MAKKYKMLNYGKKYKQMLIDLLQDTTTSIRIPDEVTTLGRNRWAYDTNLTYIDFNRVAVIPAETCRECSNLKQVVFTTNTTSIGQYAFYRCTKFEDTELPHTLTSIGQYAFYQAGSSYERGTHTFTLIDNVGIHTTIDSNAFYGSHLSEIDAYTNNIGGFAFYGCSSLTDVSLEIHGSLGDNAFYQCSYVENFEIKPASVITSLASGVFQTLATVTAAGSRNIAPFDFRNSTFTSVGSGVWANNYYSGTVYFPMTLTTINGNFLDQATGNWKLYFNSVPTVSSSSYLRSDTSNFTVKYFFPYNLLDTAMSTTNWSSHTSQMIGYGSGFEAGATLPEYDRNSGKAITWYDDDTLTSVITVSVSATDVYYCTLGSVRIVWFVKEDTTLVDASVIISDGTNTYTVGDFILVGTSITITPSPTDSDKQTLFVLKVNGTDYTTSGSATITMDQDLTVKCMYWDGVNPPFFPTLADND